MKRFIDFGVASPRSFNLLMVGRNFVTGSWTFCATNFVSRLSTFNLCSFLFRCPQSEGFVARFNLFGRFRRSSSALSTGLSIRKLMCWKESNWLISGNINKTIVKSEPSLARTLSFWIEIVEVFPSIISLTTWSTSNRKLWRCRQHEKWTQRPGVLIVRCPLNRISSEDFTRLAFAAEWLFYEARGACQPINGASENESLLKLDSVLSRRNLGVALKCRKRLFRNSLNFNKPNWLQLAGVGEENDFGAPFSLEIHFCLSWLIKGFERGKKVHKSRNTCNRMTPWKSNASTRT